MAVHAACICTSSLNTKEATPPDSPHTSCFAFPGMQVLGMHCIRAQTQEAMRNMYFSGAMHGKKNSPAGLQQSHGV